MLRPKVKGVYYWKIDWNGRVKWRVFRENFERDFWSSIYFLMVQ